MEPQPKGTRKEVFVVHFYSHFYHWQRHFYLFASQQFWYGTKCMCTTSTWRTLFVRALHTNTKWDMFNTIVWLNRTQCAIFSFIFFLRSFPHIDAHLPFAQRFLFIYFYTFFVILLRFMVLLALEPYTFAFFCSSSCSVAAFILLFCEYQIQTVLKPRRMKRKKIDKFNSFPLNGTHIWIAIFFFLAKMKIDFCPVIEINWSTAFITCVQMEQVLRSPNESVSLFCIQYFFFLHFVSSDRFRM